MEPTCDIDVFAIIVKATSTVLGLSFDSITKLAENSTFVKLGGDSLAAIQIAAKCQKSGVCIAPCNFLRTSSLTKAFTTAQISAQLCELHPVATALLEATPSLPVSRSPEALVSVSSLYSVARQAEISSFRSGVPLSSYATTLATPDLDKSNTLLGDGGRGAITATDLLDRVIMVDWTELQLLFLRETSRDSGRNMLTLQKTYNGEWDASLICDTWVNTIMAEPLFKDLVANFDTPAQRLLPWEIIRVETEDDFQKAIRNASIICGPLFTLTVVDLDHSFVTVIWRVHHAFMDGFSARILQDKISQNLIQGERTIGPGPSFKEMVHAIESLRKSRSEATRRFWDRKRSLFSSAIGELTLNPQRAHDESLSQQCIKIMVPEAELSAARTRTGYTSTVYFAAAWALTFSTFADTDQIYFGMALSGRDLPILGTFDVVGPLMNILPLFVQLPAEDDRETSIRAFLRSIQEGILEINDVQTSDTSEGFMRHFTSIMASELDDWNELTSANINMHHVPMQSGVPLNLVLRGPNHLEVFYSTERYSEEDMENILSIFQTRMGFLLQEEDERPLQAVVWQQAMAHEMEQTVRQWSNCGSVESLEESKGDDLVTLFENIVAKQPTTLAVYNGREPGVSYDDFDRAAAAVAREISWIRDNEPICVYADRSINWLVAIFGILKAGGVYAPLDPLAPSPVRQANFVRSGARAMLFPSSLSITGETRPAGCLLTLGVDGLLQNATRSGSRTPSYPRRRIARPDDLAYICFTSGSTGEPKAVQCTHKSLVAFQKDYIIRLSAKKGTVIAQVMSPLFDGSIHEIFSTLTYGATLRLGSPETQEHPFSHLHDCDSAILTPSIASALNADQYPNLHDVYFVGEPVPQSVCDAWSKKHKVYNMYGPTEATCGATIKQLVPTKAVTLGHAVPSSRVYILDRNKHLLPPGAVGELYVAGIQVSNGYIGLSVENASRFVLDSISPDSCQNMYKTGDFAYRDSKTGEIHIVGRKDRQIKLRGFRLDLNDLEIRITNIIPHCKSTAVFCRDDYLIAAFQVPSISKYSLNEADIRELVNSVLPPYATPRRILALPELPLTPAGKLDYKKLAQIDEAGVATSQTRQRSMTATEMMIAGAVRDLMKLDASIPIDRESNLTALGGHSIMQLQLASRITAIIGRRFTVKTVIDNPAIGHMASRVDEVVHSSVAEIQDEWVNASCLRGIRAETTLEFIGASPIECAWLSKYQQKLGTSSFNVSHVSELHDSFDQHAALVSAWSSVLERHTILRCRFRSSAVGSKGAERFYAAEPPVARYVDWFDLRDGINNEFSLGTEHPVRVMISKTHMLICLSHIICDYSTLNQLLDEFSVAYHHALTAEISLPPARRRYEEKSFYDTAVDQHTRQFWHSYLSGMRFGLPSYMVKARGSYHGESRMFRLSKDAVYSLASLSQSLHLTMHQIVLGIISLVLQADESNKQDIILGSPFLGRQEEDMNTIGLFLQALPIRVPRPSKMGIDLAAAPVRDFLLAVQDSARSALSHGIAWASLMDVLSLSDDEDLRLAPNVPSPNHPLFNAMVTFHEFDPTSKTSSSGGLAIPGIEPLISWAEGAKFGIMFEFSALSPLVVTLRIEYDTSIFPRNQVLKMADRIDTGLEYLGNCITSPITIRDLEDRLSCVDSPSGPSKRVENIKFGTRVADLVN
ncbi:hypothetical protein F4802DRAFT_579052 [Xylaria palmicola]|nr:hypothetical protein F4802DRAFT_579052 [Xylaria palmicola]